MNIEELNKLSDEESEELFLKCCGCRKWIELMVASKPFLSIGHLINCSQQNWNTVEDSLRMEAFLHHPKIGDINSLREKYSSTRSIAESEQSGMNSASDEILKELSELNTEYEKKFGFIFIVFATGKSAGEMLNLIRQRLKNNKETELKIAMTEQNKITNLRLEKLL